MIPQPEIQNEPSTNLRLQRSFKSVCAAFMLVEANINLRALRRRTSGGSGGGRGALEVEEEEEEELWRLEEEEEEELWRRRSSGGGALEEEEARTEGREGAAVKLEPVPCF